VAHWPAVLFAVLLAVWLPGEGLGPGKRAPGVDRGRQAPYMTCPLLTFHRRSSAATCATAEGVRS
jgi:hypothetical protein